MNANLPGRTRCTRMQEEMGTRALLAGLPAPALLPALRQRMYVYNLW